MNSRRTFIRNTGLFTISCSLPGIAAYPITPTPMTAPKISLAQWSLHRALENKLVKAEDFASIASNEYGIRAIEYVNSFYMEKGGDEAFWSDMHKKASNEGVQSLLIMVDGEGDLGSPDSAMRKAAVENHYKWVNAIKILGGHSIRVNAFGQGSHDSLRDALSESLAALATYSGKENIHVLIENHGLHTSDATFITDIIKTVDSPFLGTLPDFGNWCLTAEWGSTQANQCQNIYDPLKGVTQFLPFAGGVSAKSYAFDQEGNETIIDYPALLKAVKDSGYTGYIGVEYEGNELSEGDGIRMTKRLIERVWNGLD